METMTAHDAEKRFPRRRPPGPRRALGATVVAGLYVLLVLGAPLIVRYGPRLDSPVVAVAAATAAAATAPRCATAPEFGRSCER